MNIEVPAVCRRLSSSLTISYKRFTIQLSKVIKPR